MVGYSQDSEDYEGMQSPEMEQHMIHRLNVRVGDVSGPSVTGEDVAQRTVYWIMSRALGHGE
jgi:hypothetical protein